MLTSNANSLSTDPQWNAVGNAFINASGKLIEDINSHVPLPPFGRGLSTFTIEENGNRSTVRNRLDELAAKRTGKLTIKTNTLATKILLCQSRSGDITAYGLSTAPGAKLPIAEGFVGREHLKEVDIFAKREVIVSAGAFQSPQLVRFHLRQCSRGY